MGADRSGPTPHSVRELTASLQSWPPPGWTPEGIDRHRDQCRRARALLLACTPPSGEPDGMMVAAEVLDAERSALDSQRSALSARALELRQFGSTLERTAHSLRDATDAVLAMPGLAAADTSPIRIQESA